uniref:Uncharacterized protein n=1 Tax=Amphora coffeiformis TaxID=265554 RepID=A0A7S3KYB6_9STRA
MSFQFPWLSKMKANEGKRDMDGGEDGSNAEVTHRRRLAQILRYIANMHHSLQSEGVGPSFVQEGRRDRPPSDFFQLDEQQGEWILFTTTDFRLLLSAEQNAQSGGPLFPSPPFSFYAAVTEQKEGGQSPRKRMFSAAFKSDGASSNTTTNKESSVDGKTCWMRITRLTNAQIATTPPESVRRSAVRNYLEGWLMQTPDAGRLEDLLTLDRLARPPKSPPGYDVRERQEVNSFLRQYRRYLRRKAYHEILEPMYNHLFEWVQQQSDEELVFGLGHARYFHAPTSTWISSPVLEVLVEVEVSRKDGSLLLRPRDHTGVTLHRPFLAALTETGHTTMTTLHQKVADCEPCHICPGQPETYATLLQEIAVQVSADGSFQSSARTKPDDSSKLVITEAWCLFRRPKPSTVWARDATKFADQILMKQPSDTLALPLASWALTFGPQAVERERAKLIVQDSPRKGFFGQFFARNEATKTPSTGPTKPLFPLPTSVPQTRIAELLLNQKYPAVVCEGPPGSGKSHTICNIVCAYLCQGKRVLVTSKNAHALGVLRERLPVAVRDLCVDISMSELSGMRQLQQTVERLANRVSMVCGDLETQKCEFLRDKIRQLEVDIEAVDEEISQKSASVRELLLKPEGQEFSSLSLELIESVPWLMRTVCQWTLQEIKSLRNTVRDLVLEDGDPVGRISGFEHPPSDALIAKVAARAGEPLHRISASAKSVTASIPLVGTFTGMKEREDQLENEIAGLKLRDTVPGTSAEWSIVARALRRARAFFKFETTVWKVHEYKNAWPAFSEIKSNENIRSLADKLDKAVKVKALALKLGVDDEIEAAAQCRSQDMQRSILVCHKQRMAEELVDATVLVQLSRSFSPEAQSALIRFAQIAGRARFSRNAQASRMTQRQRRRRQEYLAAFDQCCRFIPCWILTTSQISDYLPAEGLFDLVVVDEASQSDVTVIPGMLRGKQWLIVGDSKQVSPTESFISEEQIYGLQAALPPSPLRDSLLPGNSFFDLCSQAFPGGRVVLSEHFRCSEDIISFSNEHFYDGQLVPLRLPTKSERLTPSLVDVKVNGVKQGKINQAEVVKIVELIKEHVDEGQLSGIARSIGVISLIGDEQSRMIRARLLDAIGPQAMSQHDILIGDPPSFQGAERDIIFLTMIASPRSVPTQNQLMHFQRLNVAMSRARDRCYLVRSIDAHDIPNAEDSKLLLLTFFQSDQSAKEQSDPNGGVVSRNLYDRLLANLLEERGYKVRQMGQVWRHGLCVESAGCDARAAILVDCVGEPVHEWSRSYNQQRAIERVGWKCFRIDAVSLVTDFHGALQNIVTFLEKCGIEERKVLFDALEEEEEDVEVVEEDAEEDRGGSVVNNVVAPEVGEDQGGNEGDDDAEGGDANMAPPVPAEEEVYVISSDDEGKSDDRDSVKMQAPVPDGVRSSPADALVDQPDQFGQVVDLGFLRNSVPDTDIEDFAARSKARAKEHFREGEYEGDASDMGDSLLSRASKKRRRLDNYARDPRWFPGKSGVGEDEDESKWYDTDSDLPSDKKSDSNGNESDWGQPR